MMLVCLRRSAAAGGGDVLAVELPAEADVRRLRQEAASACRLPVAVLGLAYQGQKLTAEDANLADLGIGPESMVDVDLRVFRNILLRIADVPADRARDVPVGRYLSFANRQNMLRAHYQKGDAMPLQCDYCGQAPSGHAVYQLRNKWPGEGTGWVGLRSGDYSEVKALTGFALPSLHADVQDQKRAMYVAFEPVDTPPAAQELLEGTEGAFRMVAYERAGDCAVDDAPAFRAQGSVYIMPNNFSNWVTVMKDQELTTLPTLIPVSWAVDARILAWAYKYHRGRPDTTASELCGNTYLLKGSNGCWMSFAWREHQPMRCIYGDQGDAVPLTFHGDNESGFRLMSEYPEHEGYIKLRRPTSDISAVTECSGAPHAEAAVFVIEHAGETEVADGEIVSKYRIRLHSSPSQYLTQEKGWTAFTERGRAITFVLLRRTPD
eukprot:TRINITY_DN18054_c0_g1_i1.p1 TRINITY_DN18054_c0_g1~~TRINITY_DN18054_c0_g1_i1.p1  ORF type:complete len:463 (+),score=103.00 TRINITY_DN18054_c0_g1_i1:86-1390(+)